MGRDGFPRLERCRKWQTLIHGPDETAGTTSRDGQARPGIWVGMVSVLQVAQFCPARHSKLHFEKLQFQELKQ